MFIDKNIDYQVGDFCFRNFLHLNNSELLMILKERNHPNVKKWMVSKDDITKEEHIEFVNGLKSRDDAYYWLIYHNDKPVGVLSLIHCDYDKEEGEAGYYLFNSYQDEGIGLDLHYNYKKFFFEYLHLKNLPGRILWGNTNAYQISKFFGAELDSVKEIDNRKFIFMHTSKDAFLSVPSEKLTSRFINFIKTNPIIWE